MAVRVRLAAFAAGILFAFSSGASAQQMVYTPINPSFGGNPFNSQHLLGIANAQNNFKDPDAANSGSQSDIFARQLQSRLLSALSNNIVNAIFGPNAQNNGTVDFGGQTIAWTRELDQVTVTITDDDTGQVTTIVVPTDIAITGG
ncbi:MAG: curli assembly protein CsgF [Bacillota bacterium]